MAFPCLPIKHSALILVLSIAICGPLSGATEPESRFVNGVTKTSGWYDVNKQNGGHGIPGTDSLLCWAAASSNVLQWWQDKQAYVPEGIPTGADPNGVYELDIFQVMVNGFPDVMGNCGVINWWLTGTTTWVNPVPSSAGGYWKDYLPSSNDLATWAPTTSDTFYSSISTYIDKGCALTMWLGRVDNSNAAHYITLWGYDWNPDTGLTALWVTDSDDGRDELVRYELTTATVDSQKMPALTEDYAGWYIGGVYYLESLRVDLPIPEAGTSSLFLIGILFAGVRRKRRAA